MIWRHRGAAWQRVQRMALRIWFTAEDLARTRVATPDPFAETVFSVVPLRYGRHLLGWRNRTRPRISAELRPLLGILPGPGVLLDLMAVVGRSDSVEESIERLQRAPRHVLADEIDFFAQAAGGVPRPLRPLLHDDLRTRQDLGGRLRAYHDVAIGPHWPRLRAHLEGERARAGRQMLDNGVDGLLAGLRSDRLRWSPPVLEVLSTVQPEPESGPDHHLGGRGLLLAPSVFFWPEPVLFRDLTEREPDTLVYPAAPDLAGTAFWSGPAERGVAALLGATRAAVLTAAAGGGASTTELARRAGVSLSSASEHATVLREAGLLRTERSGSAVRHTLTELGDRLLHQR